MAKSLLLRTSTALTFGVSLAASPLSLGGPSVFGLGLTLTHPAFAKDNDSGDNRGRGGDDRAEEDRGRGGNEGRDRDRDDEREVRGRDAENEVRGRGNEPGDDRGGDRNRGIANTDRPLVGEGFTNHGDRVSTLVAIARALGYDASVGANQANFGTPQERGLTPTDQPRDWTTANLDVNKDGVVTRADLAAAQAARR